MLNDSLWSFFAIDNACSALAEEHFEFMGGGGLILHKEV